MNLYRDGIDFSALASQDVDFASFLKPNGQLDFTNPEAVQQLTKSLLKRDFGLEISLPPDRLCPPVPIRFNYVLWVQALLDTTDDSYKDVYDPEREVVGLDIGTGASCIYPILACTQRPKWRCVGTDIDEKSLQYARQNLQTNNLEDKISLLRTRTQDPLLPLDRMAFDIIDFSMCNPPFYESTVDMMKSAEAKQRPPYTACTGCESEMVTAGGEVAFVTRMIEESLLLKDRIRWYTSMLGKFSSVATLLERLKTECIDNFATAEFAQGTKTKRWAIAWSFNDFRPSMSIARGLNGVSKTLLPFPSEYQILLSIHVVEIEYRVNETLSRLPLKWQWQANIAMGIGFSEKSVWSRAARRQKSHVNEVDDDDQARMAFGFKIKIEEIAGDGAGGTKVTVRWLKGHDAVLFESFCGMMKNKLEVKT